MIKKLNLGCGEDIKRNYVNLDFVKQQGVDIVCDLSKFPWPFRDNEFDEVYASHVMEHVLDFEKTLLELKRICKKGALIRIMVPHFSCGVTYRDPTHKTFFSYFTFDYYQKENKNYEKFSKLQFLKIKRRKLNFTRLAFPKLNYIFNPVINLNQEIYERFFCWMLPCSEVIFEMEVVK
ncbi:class I SAM-dependent methyltransferase [Candidatus Pacearchaeota archaeon]|nr:class I SAM-dependent methyltransferase [Candidatus Pacearchaeota archaeon]